MAKGHYAQLLLIVLASVANVKCLEISCTGSWTLQSLKGKQAGVTVACGGRWSVANRGGSVGASNRPASSCLEIKQQGGSNGDGYYSLKSPSGGVYKAYCDMTLDGGGWTLFATKVSPNFKFITNSFHPGSASAVSTNAAGCIPQKAWKEVLFRFSTDRGASRVVYSRNSGASGAGKTAMNNAMSCGGPVQTVIKSTGGFYRHSPHVNGGRRDPARGYFTIRAWHVHPKGGQLSERFRSPSTQSGFLTMWTAAGGNGYFHADSNAAKGTKCVAGSCSLTAPIWLMYR